MLGVLCLALFPNLAKAACDPSLNADFEAAYTQVRSEFTISPKIFDLMFRKRLERLVLQFHTGNRSSLRAQLPSLPLSEVIARLPQEKLKPRDLDTYALALWLEGCAGDALEIAQELPGQRAYWPILETALGDPERMREHAKSASEESLRLKFKAVASILSRDPSGMEALRQYVRGFATLASNEQGPDAFGSKTLLAALDGAPPPDLPPLPQNPTELDLRLQYARWASVAYWFAVSGNCAPIQPLFVDFQATRPNLAVYAWPGVEAAAILCARQVQSE